MLVEGVFEKLQQFPHMFEIAMVQGRLDTLDLNGEVHGREAHDMTHLRYQGWTVPLKEIHSFLRSGTLTPAILELLAKHVHPFLPRTTVLRRATGLRRNKANTDHLGNRRTKPTIQLFPYLSDTKAWGLFVVDTTDATAPTLHRVLPELHAERAFEYVTKSLTKMYAPPP